MEIQEARARLNYLLTLNIRREEAFGPLSLAFIKEPDFDGVGLSAEERFNLVIATVQALDPNPKRHHLKLELLRRAKALLVQTFYFNHELARHLEQDIQKTEAELTLYSEAMRPEARAPDGNQHRLIVQSDAPEYFLDIAQKRAASYYQNKYSLSREARTAQHFAGCPRKFDPDNQHIQKEFPGACGPFMNSRVNAFHLMFPFDLKISRKPEAPLEAGARIFYAKMGYSFPLCYERDKYCSYHDGQVVEIPIDDPHLLFVSFSAVKEPQFKGPPGMTTDVPPRFAYPATVLDRVATLGTFVQIPTNFKVWFDASAVSLLVQGAPDLPEYGALGGTGLMMRSHASDKLDAYVESTREPWQEGLSFNFVNVHLQLAPGVDTAVVPYNTPIFTVHPTHCLQNYKFEDVQSARARTNGKPASSLRPA